MSLTLQDFLNNPAAQHAAFVAHVANIDDAIANTPGADKYNPNGLRAVAHLGGVQGMRNFVASGGNLNSQDSHLGPHSSAWLPEILGRRRSRLCRRRSARCMVPTDRLAMFRRSDRAEG